MGPNDESHPLDRPRLGFCEPIRDRSRFFDGFGMGASSTFGSSTFTSMMAGRPLSEM